MILNLILFAGWLGSGSAAGASPGRDSVWYGLPQGFNQSKPDSILELLGYAPLAFDGVYMFGDSACDTGNLFNSSGHTDPDPKVYWRGRQCNGPMWPDYLQARHRFKFRNYAFGGAVVSKANNVVLDVPDFHQQVAIHKESPALDCKKALAVIQFAGNDLINQMVTPARVAHDIGESMRALIGLGEINDFLLVQSPVAAYDAHGLNTAIVAMVDALAAANKANIKTLAAVGIYAAMAKVAPAPADASIWAMLEAHCYDTISKQLCTDPQNHLYFDNYHPSTVPNYNFAMYTSDAIASFWPI